MLVSLGLLSQAHSAWDRAVDPTAKRQRGADSGDEGASRAGNFKYVVFSKSSHFRTVACLIRFGGARWGVRVGAFSCAARVLDATQKRCLLNHKLLGYKADIHLPGKEEARASNFLAASLLLLLLLLCVYVCVCVLLLLLLLCVWFVVCWLLFWSGCLTEVQLMPQPYTSAHDGG